MVPSPTWPQPLKPQHQRLWFDLGPQVWGPPGLTADHRRLVPTRAGVSWSVRVPVPGCPQRVRGHKAVGSVAEPDCPNRPASQHHRDRSSRSLQVWKPPADTVLRKRPDPSLMRNCCAYALSRERRVMRLLRGLSTEVLRSAPGTRRTKPPWSYVVKCGCSVIASVPPVPRCWIPQHNPQVILLDHSQEPVSNLSSGTVPRVDDPHLTHIRSQIINILPYRIDLSALGLTHSTSPSSSRRQRSARKRSPDRPRQRTQPVPEERPPDPPGTTPGAKPSIDASRYDGFWEQACLPQSDRPQMTEFGYRVIHAVTVKALVPGHENAHATPERWGPP